MEPVRRLRLGLGLLPDPAAPRWPLPPSCLSAISGSFASVYRSTVGRPLGTATTERVSLAEDVTPRDLMQLHGLALYYFSFPDRFGFWSILLLIPHFFEIGYMFSLAAVLRASQQQQDFLRRTGKRGEPSGRLLWHF